MTAYIANHQKSKAVLEKRVAGLRHAVKNSYSQPRIEKAAEKVRAAKLGVFKMEYSRDSILPAHNYEPTQKALEWERMTIEEILREYELHGT